MIKKVLASVLFAVTLVSGTGVAASITAFNDVDSTTDYQEAIFWTVETGITSGYGNGLWGPNECVRRAELMKMVMEFHGEGLLGGVVDQTPAFSDIKNDDWFYNYVMLAHKYGYIDGYPDGTFQPNRCVNRAEAMKIVVNTMGNQQPLDLAGGPIMYDDKIVSDISIQDWYGPYARYMFRFRLVGTNHSEFAGNIAGVNTMNFLPAGDMSRKEVAEMLLRMHNYRLTWVMSEKVICF